MLCFGGNRELLEKCLADGAYFVGKIQNPAFAVHRERGTQGKHVAKNHVAFDRTDFEIPLCVLKSALGMMNSVPPVIFAADMPVIEEIVVQQRAGDQRLSVNWHMQSVRQPYGQDCHVH